ncbi:MAG: transcription elongation factor GreA [Alphaproteobacteria bacterium]|nr:transcription elongation factor GreA [Alphaproteobacteria bacterium]
MEKMPITSEGLVRMEAELRQLKFTDRPEVIKAIAEAREHGDLSENAEYHAAREKQSFIEGRIQELEYKTSIAEVIDIKSFAGSDTVKFGATVQVVDEETEEEATYQIVSEYEADFDNGRISLTAPIARALIGKKKGSSVEVNTPKGARFYEIVEVDFV